MRARAAALLLAVAALAGCGRGTRPSVVEGGHPATGADVIEQVGCGGCHVIGGIPNANGHVGPNLTNWADHHTVAGVLPNESDNVIRWLLDPPAVSPRTTMPDLGLSRQQARDIAAYLYTQ